MSSVTADSHTIIRSVLMLRSKPQILNFVSTSPCTYEVVCYRKSEGTGDQNQKYYSLLSLNITVYKH